MTNKPEKKKKKKERAELDTETTFVNMNVEGFKWYDPNLEKRREAQKQNKGVIPPKVSRKEYWRMVKGAFLAFLPYFLMILLIFGILVGIAYLWLS